MSCNILFSKFSQKWEERRENWMIRMRDIGVLVDWINSNEF